MPPAGLRLLDLPFAGRILTTIVRRGMATIFSRNVNSRNQAIESYEEPIAMGTALPNLL